MHVRGWAAAAAVVGGVAWEEPDIESSVRPVRPTQLNLIS